MKRILFFLFLRFFTLPVFADDFPVVSQIVCRDSIIWINVNDGYLYKIEFKKTGKIVWHREREEAYTLSYLYMDKHKRLWKIYENLLFLYNDNEWIFQHKNVEDVTEFNNEFYIRVSSGTSMNVVRYNNGIWRISDVPIEKIFHQTGHLSEFYRNDKKESVLKLKQIHDEFTIPGIDTYTAVSVKDNDEIWADGHVGYAGTFVAFYNKKVWKRLFFTDRYESQNTHIYICEKGENCPEGEPEPDRNSYETEEEYNTALSDYLSIEGGDGYPSSLCFCDGRKIGYIEDKDGYVNFRNRPDIKSDIIGIILDRIRVFYWENENSDWWKVEINDVEGYVHQSRIKK
jgi:hypothetical protein